MNISPSCSLFTKHFLSVPLLLGKYVQRTVMSLIIIIIIIIIIIMIIIIIIIIISGLQRDLFKD